MNNRILFIAVLVIIVILILFNMDRIRNFFGRKSDSSPILTSTQTNSDTSTATPTSTSTSTNTSVSNGERKVRVSNPNGAMIFIPNPDTSMGGLKDTVQGLSFNTVVAFINKQNQHYCVKNECKMPTDFYELSGKNFVLATDVTEI